MYYSKYSKRYDLFIFMDHKHPKQTKDFPCQIITMIIDKLTFGASRLIARDTLITQQKLISLHSTFNTNIVHKILNLDRMYYILLILCFLCKACYRHFKWRNLNLKGETTRAKSWSVQTYKISTVVLFLLTNSFQ